MIIGACNSLHTPHFALVHGENIWRFIGTYAIKQGVDADVYIAFPVRNLVFDIGGGELIYFKPFDHTDCLHMYTKREIDTVCSAYKAASAKQWVSLADSIGKLFGIINEYDTALLDYLRCIKDKRDEMDCLERYYTESPMPVVLLKQPALMIRSV